MPSPIRATLEPTTGMRDISPSRDTPSPIVPLPVAGALPPTSSASLAAPAIRLPRESDSPIAAAVATLPLDAASPGSGSAVGAAPAGAVGLSSDSDDTLNHDMEKNRATRFSATSRR